MFCLKSPRKILAFPPDFPPGEEIFHKWTVSADIWAIRPKNILTKKSGGKACILRSERIVTVSKKSIFDLLYSYAHLVHSFVAETHCKLYISFICLLYFDSDDLRRQKVSPEMWYRLRMIIRKYW